MRIARLQRHWGQQDILERTGYFRSTVLESREFDLAELMAAAQAVEAKSFVDPELP